MFSAVKYILFLTFFRRATLLYISFRQGLSFSGGTTYDFGDRNYLTAANSERKRERERNRERKRERERVESENRIIWRNRRNFWQTAHTLTARCVRPTFTTETIFLLVCARILLTFPFHNIRYNGLFIFYSGRARLLCTPFVPCKYSLFQSDMKQAIKSLHANLFVTQVFFRARPGWPHIIAWFAGRDRRNRDWGSFLHAAIFDSRTQRATISAPTISPPAVVPRTVA
jgi:hypothetical protein